MPSERVRGGLTKPRFTVRRNGKPREAIGILEKALGYHPYDRELLFALATMHRETGAWEQAMGFAERLVEVSPCDRGAQQPLDQPRLPR